MAGQVVCDIRRYRSCDLRSLGRIYAASIRHLGPQRYTESQVAAWSSFPDEGGRFANWIEDASTIVAVTEQGECIGFGGIEESGHITALFVSPPYQRRGVGSRLLERLLSVAGDSGCRTVSTAASEFSRPLFERFGFRVQEIEQTVFKDVTFQRYLMQSRI